MDELWSLERGREFPFSRLEIHALVTYTYKISFMIRFPAHVMTIKESIKWKKIILPNCKKKRKKNITKNTKTKAKMNTPKMNSRSLNVKSMREYEKLKLKVKACFWWQQRSDLQCEHIFMNFNRYMREFHWNSSLLMFYKRI